MAKVTRKRTGQFVRRLTEILITNPEGVQGRDALKIVQDSFDLSEYESGYYESGGQRFEKILRFATIDLVKAGWMRKTKGIWTVTDDGREAFERYTVPETFYREAVSLYRAWKKAQDSEEEPDVEEDDQRDPRITFETAEEWAWEEVREYLDKMDPYDFQDLVADLLKAMGFYAAWVAPPGKDGGIDILAHPDPLGATSPRIKVQVKRMQSRVSVDVLRSFLAILGDDDVGLFVNTGGFTRDADLEARRLERRKITLVDAQRLFDLWVEHYDNLSDEARRRLPIKPIYFLAPEG